MILARHKIDQKVATFVGGHRSPGFTTSTTTLVGGKFERVSSSSVELENALDCVVREFGEEIGVDLRSSRLQLTHLCSVEYGRTTGVVLWIENPEELTVLTREVWEHRTDLCLDRFGWEPAENYRVDGRPFFAHYEFRVLEIALQHPRVIAKGWFR